MSKKETSKHEVKDKNRDDMDPDELLREAIQSGDLELVQEAIECGADVDSALKVCIENQDVQAMEMLIDSGASQEGYEDEIEELRDEIIVTVSQMHEEDFNSEVILNLPDNMHNPMDILKYLNENDFLTNEEKASVYMELASDGVIDTTLSTDEEEIESNIEANLENFEANPKEILENIEAGVEPYLENIEADSKEVIEKIEEIDGLEME